MYTMDHCSIIDDITVGAAKGMIRISFASCPSNVTIVVRGGTVLPQIGDVLSTCNLLNLNITLSDVRAVNALLFALSFNHDVTTTLTSLQGFTLSIINSHVTFLQRDAMLLIEVIDVLQDARIVIKNSTLNATATTGYYWLLFKGGRAKGVELRFEASHLEVMRIVNEATSTVVGIEYMNVVDNLFVLLNASTITVGHITSNDTELLAHCRKASQRFRSPILTTSTIQRHYRLHG